jgi:glycosyltransferase involved in cell wall biosynthesis
VQAVPSRWEEPFGIVAAEAMMRGTAVVASNAGGLAEIIQNSRTGVLVQPDNVDDLASALTDLLQSPKRAEQMGRSGREFALRDLRLEAFVDRFIEVYQRLVQERAFAR